MGKRRFPEYVLEEHARQLFHVHEWVGVDDNPPDHIPEQMRHRYRGQRCHRCDAVRWLRDDYRPPDGRFDGICYDFNTDNDNDTDTESE